MTIREVLHAHLPLLHPESTVRDAIDKMDIYQFPALVILDESHQLVAIVTEGDLCRKFPDLDLLKENAEQPIIKYATCSPVSVLPSMSVWEAYELMINKNLTVLPVIEKNTFFGVALRMDLMQFQLMQ